MAHRTPRRRAQGLSGLLACLIVMAALVPSASAAPIEAPVIDADPPECAQTPPEQMPPVTLATGATLDLDVRVLAERGDLKVAKRYMRTTTWAFARTGIEVDATYDTIGVPDEWKTKDGLSFVTSEELWALLKDHYRGSRPDGVDVVYYFTRYWDGGMADCIGGVANAETAFAFGSIDYAVEGIVPAPTVDEGMIAAHEIGHLLGAEHHYSNCVEAAPNGAIEGMAAVCTTLSPFATTASPIFGSLERSFVRFYAQRYAQ